MLVDVLRFTTAVCAAVEAGATVLPYRWADDGAAEFAAANGAVLAGMRERGEPSLSPADLLTTRARHPARAAVAERCGAGRRGPRPRRPPRARRLPAQRHRRGPRRGRAGRRRADRGDRRRRALARRHRPAAPGVEDLLGAGAVLAALDPAASISRPGCSPEAAAARAAFVAARPRLVEALHGCASGIELVGRGWADDVAVAAELDATASVPRLTEDGFVAPERLATSAGGRPSTCASPSSPRSWWRGRPDRARMKNTPWPWAWSTTSSMSSASSNVAHALGDEREHGAGDRQPLPHPERADWPAEAPGAAAQVQPRQPEVADRDVPAAGGHARRDVQRRVALLGVAHRVVRPDAQHDDQCDGARGRRSTATPPTASSASLQVGERLRCRRRNPGPPRRGCRRRNRGATSGAVCTQNSTIVAVRRPDGGLTVHRRPGRSRRSRLGTCPYPAGP